MIYFEILPLQQHTYKDKQLYIDQYNRLYYKIGKSDYMPFRCQQCNAQMSYYANTEIGITCNDNYCHKQQQDIDS